MINEPVDIVIVGAGASGAAIAYSLSSLGVKILCLEQGTWVNHNNFPSTKTVSYTHLTLPTTPYV